MQRLIPTHCDACGRSALVEGAELRAGAATCRECGRDARSLPGQSYAARDVALFDALVTALRAAQLPPLQASQLQSELGSRNYAPGRGLKRVAALLPSAAISQLIARGDAHDMRKAEGMLDTLLEAIAAGQRAWGTIVAAGPRQRRSTGSGSV